MSAERLAGSKKPFPGAVWNDAKNRQCYNHTPGCGGSLYFLVPHRSVFGAIPRGCREARCANCPAAWHRERRENGRLGKWQERRP